MDQAEYAADVLFRRREDLEPRYRRLLDCGIRNFGARDILSFTGRSRGCRSPTWGRGPERAPAWRGLPRGRTRAVEAGHVLLGDAELAPPKSLLASILERSEEAGADQAHEEEIFWSCGLIGADDQIVQTIAVDVAGRHADTRPIPDFDAIEPDGVGIGGRVHDDRRISEGRPEG